MCGNAKQQKSPQFQSQQDNELDRLLQHGHTPSQGETAPVHTLAKVVSFDSEQQRCKVLVEGATLTARQAASCLLAPAAGDLVLVSGPDAETLYIIAVVEQADTSKQHILLPGQVSFNAKSIALNSKESMQFESPQVMIKAKEAVCAVDETHFAGREMKVTVGMLQLVGRAYEAIVDRLSHYSKRSFRITEETEQVRTGTLDYQAENSARIHAKYTMVTAKDLVKVDSDQIHMG